MARPIRVLIADAHPIFRAGLRGVLAKQPDLAVVGEAATGDHVLRLVGEQRPDVLVLDPQTLGPGAVRVVAQIRQHHPRTRVVALSAVDDEIRERELFALGVTGYALKTEPGSAVVRAIRSVVRGDAWLSRTIVARAVPTGAGEMDRRAGRGLTRRERQLLRLVARGADVRHIAGTLDVAEQTVRNYLSRVYGKLGVHTRAEAIVWAREHDLDG